MITNGGQHEYNLGPSEIDLNWTISIEHGVAQMAPGFHSTDISAKVMEYGDDHRKNAPRFYHPSTNSAHGGGWSPFSSGGSACDDYWYQWNMPFFAITSVLDEDVLTDIMYAGRIRCRICGVLSWSIWG